MTDPRGQCISPPKLSHTQVPHPSSPLLTLRPMSAPVPCPWVFLILTSVLALFEFLLSDLSMHLDLALPRRRFDPSASFGVYAPSSAPSPELVRGLLNCLPKNSSKKGKE
jgi:hypothetical protein